MCVGKGMLIIKGKRHPVWSKTSNDHSPLVKKCDLKDNLQPELKNFIRVEMLPLGSLTSTNHKDWDFYIDEPGRLPGWFENKKYAY